MKSNHRMRYALPVLVMLSTLHGGGLMAGELGAGLDKIAECVACHGADGIGKAEQYPNLQGQGEAYLVKQLRDFKRGTRKDPAMNVIAESLSDEEVKRLARFFAQVK